VSIVDKPIIQCINRMNCLILYTWRVVTEESFNLGWWFVQPVGVR